METMKKEYKNTFLFLKGIRKYIIITVILFIVFAIAGYFVSIQVYNDNTETIKEHIKMFQDMVEEKGVLNDDGNISVWHLFLNNFWATMMSVAFGAIPFLFLPTISLIVNSVILGGVSAMMKVMQLGGAFEMFISVAPHGIFEIPALLLGIALGLKFCREISALVLSKRSLTDFVSFFSEQVRAIILIIVPLLAVAAIIESYITPVLMEMFLKV